MSKRNVIISILYFCVGAIHLYTSYFHGEYPEIEFYSKTSLIPILILSCFVLKDKKSKFIGVPILFALIFSWAGDYLLTDESRFLYGLGVFFVAHAFYIFSFVMSNEKNHEVPLLQKLPIFMFSLIFFSVLIFLKLEPNLGEMLFPVVAYVSIIVGMNIAAMNRYKKVNLKSFWYVMIGALLFYVSDAFIAFNKFNHRIENASVIIMFTYIVAQYLIVQGTLKRIDEADD